MHVLMDITDLGFPKVAYDAGKSLELYIMVLLMCY